MNFLLQIFKQKHPRKEKILNQGLSLAIGFGNNWLQSINDRFKTKYPFLSDVEIIEYNDVCQNVTRQGHELIYDSLDKLLNSNNTIGNSQLKKQFDIYMKSNFDWVSNNNLRRLYSQGCYYAWKGGLDKAIK